MAIRVVTKVDEIPEEMRDLTPESKSSCVKVDLVFQLVQKSRDMKDRKEFAR